MNYYPEIKSKLKEAVLTDSSPLTIFASKLATKNYSKEVIAAVALKENIRIYKTLNEDKQEDYLLMHPAYDIERYCYHRFQDGYPIDHLLKVERILNLDQLFKGDN